MDYIENSNIKYSISKFTKKFIINYIIGAILIGVVVYFISEFLSSFLPTSVQLIINFLLAILGFWIISSSAIETSLKEVTITSENIKNVLKNILIFLIALLVINVLFAYIKFHFSSKLLSSFKNDLIINLITQIIATIIQYGIIMMFCKDKLEEKVLGKKTNKILYIMIIVITIIILCLIMIFTNNDLASTNNNESLKNTNNSTTTNSKNNTKSTNNTDSAIANKYENEKWVEVDCLNSTYINSNIANVSIQLGHYERNIIKKYKTVKIICTIYKKSTDEIIGTSENYFEDVELEYGFSSFMRALKIKLSTSSVGNDFYSIVKAYGVKY